MKDIREGKPLLRKSDLQMEFRKIPNKLKPPTPPHPLKQMDALWEVFF